MAFRPAQFRPTTRLRLLLGVLAVGIVPLLTLAHVSMNRQREVAIEEAYTSLEGIASAQVGHLESVIAADEDLADLIATNEQLRTALRAHETGTELDRAQLESILADAMHSSDRLVNICLHGRDGSVVSIVDPSAHARYRDASIDPGVHDYTSLVIEGPAGGPTAVTNSPIIVDGERLGTVTIETDASEITALATDYEGLNRTGETSVAQPTADGAQFIAPLRFKDDAVLNVTVPASKVDAPISLAVAGEEGRLSDTVDYRQADVLAVTRTVDSTGWGVVVKIDRDEALEGVGHFQRTVAVTVAAALVFVVLMSLALGRAVWKPVTEVTAAAVAVAGGDRSRRADVQRRDELGDLARAVNVMTDDLMAAATADAERRAELEELNELLVVSERELRHQASHDGLTGLANRTHLRAQLDAALADDARSAPVAVLFIDLDRFKLVNDSRGHSAGDQLLAKVAARLAAAVNPDDVVARFGGDEFVVLCPDADADQAQDLARRIHRSLEHPVIVNGDPEHLACSIGIAISSPGVSSDALLSNADVAMYRAKAAGRNRTMSFDSDMRSWVESRHEVESALRHAIGSGELTVHYQPIVELVSGEITGLEALSRWDRPGHGAVNPQQFIAVAEDSGLIVPLGRSVLRTVCEQQVAWRGSHPEHPLRCTVNLSARELAQPDCFDAIQTILDETGAEPSAITLELTETALSSDLDASLRNLTLLRDAGFSIAIDDFGTGYSSLTYLRQFPIDVVKIDRSFMTELEQDSAESSIVALVIGLGANLDLDVVAEGVETTVQLDALRELNCRYAQGYLFARPQPADEITHLLWPAFDVDQLADFDMAAPPTGPEA